MIGTGSACSSNSAKRRSRVMSACGVGEDYIDGVLRLSFSHENTVEEAEAAARILSAAVQKDRELTN